MHPKFISLALHRRHECPFPIPWSIPVPNCLEASSRLSIGRASTANNKNSPTGASKSTVTKPTSAKLKRSSSALKNIVPDSEGDDTSEENEAAASQLMEEATFGVKAVGVVISRSTQLKKIKDVVVQDSEGSTESTTAEGSVFESEVLDTPATTISTGDELSTQAKELEQALNELTPRRRSTRLSRNNTETSAKGKGIASAPVQEEEEDSDLEGPVVTKGKGKTADKKTGSMGTIAKVSIKAKRKIVKSIYDVDVESITEDEDFVVPVDDEDEAPIMKTRKRRRLNNGKSDEAFAKELQKKEYAKGSISTDDEDDEDYVDDQADDISVLSSEDSVVEVAFTSTSVSQNNVATSNNAPTNRLAGRYIAESRSERARRRLLELHPELANIWKVLSARQKPAVERATQPEGMTLTMMPFQLEGLNWLRKQEESVFKGGILADEMGMGKTIQTISLLMSEPRKKPNLVVAPTVALMQWKSEIEKHTGGILSVAVFHGQNRPKSVKEVENIDVVMTTCGSYPSSSLGMSLICIDSVLESVFRKQNSGFKRKEGMVKEPSVLHKVKFERVILDEAHNIKDRTCNTARAVYALQTKTKWCLSGTPLQNRIGELFSLLRFLEIDPFAFYYCRTCNCKSLHWKFSNRRNCDECHHTPMEHVCFFNNEFLKPIQTYGNAGPGKEAMGNLQVLLGHIMLRRTKVERADDLGLPPRIVHIKRAFFNEEELDLYASVYGDSKRKFDTYVAAGVVLNNYANIFTLITRMRQLADHPDLVLRRSGEGGDNTLVCEICDEEAEEAIKSRCHHIFCRMCVQSYIDGYCGEGSPECPRCHVALNIDVTQPSMDTNTSLKKGSIINRINMENWRSSTKIETLVNELFLLRGRSTTMKSIVFSQFTSMLQLVEWRLRRAGFSTVMLEGSMSPSQREGVINHFMTTPEVEVFLVSLKAGGVALNLTEASHVFILDPWWNPSVEWQSGDRVHRIGQKRNCQITRLVIEDSIESRIVDLQEKKANLIRATVGGDQKSMDKLTPADMQFLFQN